MIACRSARHGAETARDIQETVPGAGAIDVMELDLSSFESVWQFSARLTHRRQPISILVNNAGILRWRGWVSTQAGVEEHLHANYLGHFLLVRELLPLLTEVPGSRIISIGSNIANHAHINWENMNALEGFAAYGQSKLCNLLHMQELHYRYNKASSLCAFCVDPGEVKPPPVVVVGGGGAAAAVVNA